MPRSIGYWNVMNFYETITTAAYFIATASFLIAWRFAQLHGKSSASSDKYSERIWEYFRNVFIQSAAMLFAVGTGILTFDLKIRSDETTLQANDLFTLKKIIFERMQSIAHTLTSIQKDIIPIPLDGCVQGVECALVIGPGAIKRYTKAMEDAIARIKLTLNELKTSDDFGKSSIMMNYVNSSELYNDSINVEQVGFSQAFVASLAKGPIWSTVVMEKILDRDVKRIESYYNLIIRTKDAENRLKILDYMNKERYLLRAQIVSYLANYCVSADLFTSAGKYYMQDYNIFSDDLNNTIKIMRLNDIREIMEEYNSDETRAKLGIIEDEVLSKANTFLYGDLKCGELTRKLMTNFVLGRFSICVDSETECNIIGAWWGQKYTRPRSRPHL